MIPIHLKLIYVDFLKKWYSRAGENPFFMFFYYQNGVLACTRTHVFKNGVLVQARAHFHDCMFNMKQYMQQHREPHDTIDVLGRIHYPIKTNYNI